MIIIQVAHPLVRDQLLNFIYNGFLVPVLGPALHQVSPLLMFYVTKQGSTRNIYAIIHGGKFQFMVLVILKYIIVNMHLTWLFAIAEVILSLYIAKEIFD